MSQVYTDIGFGCVRNGAATLVSKQVCFHPIYERPLEFVVSCTALWSGRYRALFLGYICSPQIFIDSESISQSKVGVPFLAQECHDVNEMCALRGVSTAAKYMMPRNTGFCSIVVPEPL